MTELDDPYKRPDSPNPSSPKSNRWSAALVAENGPDSGTRWLINKPVFVIGGADDCDLTMTQCQLAQYHAYVFVRDHVVSLRHLGPSPVITVNGRMMRWGELQDGDLLTLGTTTIRFELRKVASPSCSKFPLGTKQKDDLLTNRYSFPA